jgi:TPP-dependent 2-oxoacid decarboxylase
LPYQPSPDTEILAEALAEAMAILNLPQHLIILAGAEIHRFGLED